MKKNKQKSSYGFFSSLMFILSFMKKYAFILILVLVFLFITTFFNVQSPKLMGNAIDEMITYVGERKIENIMDDVEAKKGISEEDKDLIIEQGNLTKEQETNIIEATPDQLYNMYVVSQYKKELFEFDNSEILSGDGFSQEQQDYINGLDIPQQYKQGLLFLDNKTILSEYIGYVGGITSEEQNAIRGAGIPTVKSLYNITNVRIDAIELDNSIITREEGFSDKQIKFIDKSDLTYKEKTYIKESTPEEIKEAYANRHIDINADEQYKTFLHVIFLLLLMFVSLAISMFVYNLLMVIVAGKSTRDMRKGLFGKVENLSIRFFDMSNAGDLLSRFTNDIDNISNALNQSIVQVLSQVAMLIGVIIMMFNEDNTMKTLNLFGNEFVLYNILTWVMIIFAIIAILLALIIIKYARYYVSRQQEKLGKLNGYIDERISGQKVIISYGLEEETIQEFEEYNEDLRKTSVLGQIYSGALMPTMQGIGLVNLGFLVFLGSVFVTKDLMTIGLLVAFIQYSQRFFNPLAQVVAQYNLLELAITGAGRVKEVFVEPVTVLDNRGAVEINGIEGKVSLENVNFSYEEGKPILKDINIEVNQGEMIALVGPTGSGKTTVMNLMNRFYDIDSGSIKFDGKEIQDITIESLRKNVGIVLQESILFDGTIRYNIAYGNKDASMEEVIAAAKTANIHEFIMTLEDGYDTHVDNNTSMFSTGQKQLMSIARTILTDPDLLILDEATSNVDTVTEARIQKAMENVMDGRTSFVIAHRLKTILNATKIIVLKDGEIIEEGSHQELLKEKGFYAELYYNQFVVEE